MTALLDEAVPEAAGADAELDAAPAEAVALGGDPPTDRSFGGGRAESGHDRVAPEMHRMVDEAVRVAGAAGDVVVHEELLWAERAAPEIVRYGQAERADLIVLATQGYGAVKRALLGSVAAAVARDARSCVLLVPSGLWSAAED